MKDVNMSTSQINEEATNESKVESDDSIKEPAAIAATETVSSFLGDALGQADKALAAYVEAQKNVLRKYRQHELETDKSYKETENQANSDYEQFLEQATASRAEAERQAETAYRDARIAAGRTYDEKMKEDLKGHNQALEQARLARDKSMEQLWKIFGRETDK
jgi:hypothetical protein